MLCFQDSTAVIDEPKTARMEQRTRPSVKAQIQQDCIRRVRGIECSEKGGANCRLVFRPHGEPLRVGVR